MLALGIDPGSAICGYGFVEQVGGQAVAKNFGVITTSPKARMQDRLLKIHTELDALIKTFQPQIMGIEKLFFREERDDRNPRRASSRRRFTVCGSK